MDIISKKNTPLQCGNIGLAAERTDGAGVNGRAAARTLALQKLAAHRAMPAADWIRRLAVGKEKPHLLDEILLVRRTTRIRTKSACRKANVGSRWGFMPNGGCRERKVELLRQLLNDLVVELCPVALLEHRKRRLLAADFDRKLALSQTRLAASQLHFLAKLWTQVFTAAILWTLFYQLSRG